MRRNKKQEYINGLEYDIKTCKENIASPKFFTYWHGELFTRSKYRNFLHEFEKELAMVRADKNYKPWKEYDY